MIFWTALFAIFKGLNVSLIIPMSFFASVNSNLSSTVDTVACQSLTWNGNTYTESGTYYWKIITKDNQGSNSDSGVSMFKVEW